MDEADHATWAQAPDHQQQPAPPGPGDDLSDFFDFDNMDLMSNYPPFEDGSQQQRPQPLSEGFDRDAAMRDPEQAARNWAMANKFQQQHQQHQLDQHRMHHQQYQPQRGIPATPTSTELFPTQYLPDRRGQLSDGRFVGRLDDLAMYTPDMTPNVTGSDSVYSAVPEYAMPGSYMNQLSPLTSPAMRPQTQGGAYHAGTAGSSLAASPIDLSFDATADTSSGAERPRKTRKKAAGSATATATTANTSTTRTRTTSKAAAAATKRKISPDASAAVPTAAKGPLADAQDGVRSAQPSPLVTMLASQRDDRDTASKSISPRPLSEARMAPPPKPHPASAGAPAARGPFERLTQSALGGPATPASLMRLQTQRANANFSPSTSAQQSPLTGSIETGMGFLALPESAAPLDLGNAGIKPASRPPPSPASTRPGSALASPTGSLAKGQSKASNTRKRASQSNMVSPALRPKISPSIKPLLPEGGHPRYSQDEHTMLLASKSNYQNLLEGNTVPGVHYPAELATNLTSKRTSHKIAEQGRRNRINTALQEMQSLLPPALSRAAAKDMPYDSGTNSPSGDAETGENGTAKNAPPSGGKNEGKGGSSAQGGNSKAATVELAIQYIKSLNGKLADQTSENERLRKEMARLKKAAGMSTDEESDKASPLASSPAVCNGAATEEKGSEQGKAESSHGGNSEDSSSGSTNGESADSAMADA